MAAIGQFLACRYLKPRRFELVGQRIIYEFIGMRIFKRYVPTTGDLVRQWRASKQIVIGEQGRFQVLYEYERQTRRYEWRHVGGAIGFVLLAVLINKPLTLVDWVFLTWLNLTVNIYPIFLQRYNRIRILDVLRRYNQPSPYSACA
ncbi:glycosyl-4,4'-diaponeurosporenoate acyltransferase CrtO family protein [Fibrisoma limi]|uniref:glycosyl-4,4'-diaponeurosporenoate acyltransferase CrtO family protein n=1 Tax=Fibrisoma limi TaxID=663275 RepID=UPI0002E7B82E|nr:hypothetical protein [Fibrisoma limi]